MSTQKFKKVLCVNDNEVTLWVYKQILNNTSLSEEVVTSANGREALEYCQKLIGDNEELELNYPRLILLDLHMPEMDGWQFLDHFSNKIWPYFKNTKVVITSYSIDTDLKDRIKEYPFVVDFLTSALSTAYLKNLHKSLELSISA